MVGGLVGAATSAALVAVSVEVTPLRALGFLLAMGIGGYAIGQLLGDDYRLLGALDRGRGRAGPRPADADATVAALVSELEVGEVPAQLDDVIKLIRSADDVADLFSEDRIQRMVALLQDPNAPADPAKKAWLEAQYRLLAHISQHAAEPLRLAIACTLGRILPWHRGLAPWLLTVCARHPDLWNDVQSRFDDAAARDPSVKRFLEAHASHDKAFVQRANDLFMSEMQRFQRLCQDYAAGLEAIPAAELDRMIQRELTVVDLSGGTSRRFMWLPSNVRVVLDRLSDAQVLILLGAARRGVPGACALTSRAVLVWSINDQPQLAEEAVDALADAAREHPAAADALFGLLHGIRPTRRHPKLTPVQASVHRIVWEQLQEAARDTYNVRSLLQTHGLINAAYAEPDEEESTLESTNF